MSWRDFFYFAKGERRALIVVLCLIAVAAIFLIVTKRVDEKAETITVQKAENVKSQQLPNDSSQTKLPEKQSVTKTKSYESKNKKESVSERVERLTTSSRPSYPRTEKFKEGTVVELNTADTTMLKKVPGIGSAFANRIVKYRNLLGGYYSVKQLSEVYGMDEERYAALVLWFTVDASLVHKLAVNQMSQDSLRRHPYIDYKQAKVISQLCRQKGKLTGWENLQLLDEFTEKDKERLLPYLSFE